MVGREGSLVPVALKAFSADRCAVVALRRVAAMRE